MDYKDELECAFLQFYTNKSLQTFFFSHFLLYPYSISSLSLLSLCSCVYEWINEVDVPNMILFLIECAAACICMASLMHRQHLAFLGRASHESFNPIFVWIQITDRHSQPHEQQHMMLKYFLPATTMITPNETLLGAMPAWFRGSCHGLQCMSLKCCCLLNKLPKGLARCMNDCPYSH